MINSRRIETEKGTENERENPNTWKKNKAKMMKNEDIKIPIFDGSEYCNWIRRILKFLEFKKCKCVVERERTREDGQEEWQEMDVKAVNYI